jgi:hypothetical protein
MKLIHLLLAAITGVSCSAIQETSSHQMENGIYKVSNNRNKRFYTVVEADRIMLYPVAKTKAGWLANKDSATAVKIQPSDGNNKVVTFTTNSFDLDVLTILFKYRPYTAGFPNQLTTNFNGAGFLGRRLDLYRLSFDKNPLNEYQRRMSHFAYSVGFFAGMGATTINPFVTGNQVQSEYDGVVITKGIAGLLGVGNLTFGATIGLDHLMDNNHSGWIYQGKPWVGFGVGLNIN